MVFRTLLMGLAIGLALAVQPTVAQERQIEVARGVLAPLPVAVPTFGTGPHAAELAEIIRNNLARSGRFAPLDPIRYVEQSVDINAPPNFQNWSLIGAQYLVTGASAIDPDGRLQVSYRLWDVAAQREIPGATFTAPEENWRRPGHNISDAVYEELTGQTGYFDTWVAFVSESGPRTLRRRVLTLMDQDGYNPFYLTDGSAQIFNPRFSRDGKSIVYMALRDSGSELYIRNIDTGRQESLGSFQGMAIAPSFSPDGSRVAFSLSRNGNTDVFVTEVRVGGSSRLTSDPGIDTSPSFSPDNARIVFNSDRSGGPQLYIMNADGSGQRRLSNGSGRYTTPAWSPDGQWIAFTKQTGGQFHIGIMRPDGSDERLLTTSYLDEGPSWAPNSQFIIFSREAPGAGARLWSVDLTGRDQAAPSPGAGSDPSWSPLRE